MRGGDISNETPPRIIVTIDTVVESEVVEERTLLSKKLVRKVGRLNNAALSYLWNKSFQYGLAVELAAFEEDHWTQAHVDKLMEKLDNRGGNPFNYSELYESTQSLVDELPYRTNLKAVITDGKSGRFGSWGIDLQNL